MPHKQQAACTASKDAHRHDEVIHFGTRVQARVRPGGCAGRIVSNIAAKERLSGDHHALGCGAQSCRLSN